MEKGSPSDGDRSSCGRVPSVSDMVNMTDQLAGSISQRVPRHRLGPLRCIHSSLVRKRLKMSIGANLPPQLTLAWRVGDLSISVHLVEFQDPIQGATLHLVSTALDILSLATEPQLT